MQKMLIGIGLCLTLTVAAWAQANDAQAKGEQIIKKARAAIADEGKFKSLQALSMTGTSRQTFGDRQMESELQVDILLPDKIMRTNNSQFATTINTLNGDQMWSDFVPGVGMGGGGGMMVMRGGPGGGPGGPGGMPADSPLAKYMQQGQRRDLMLPMLTWLLSPPPAAQVQYVFLGEAPGPEGSKLNAVQAKNENGLNLVLYFNQETSQLIGVKYKAKQMRMGGGRGPGGGGPGAPGGGQRAAGGQGGQGAQPAQPGQGGQGGQRPEITPEERERRMKEAMEQFEKAPEVDFSWAFLEYKNVNGFNLPHVMTRSQGGTANEEWTISKYKINPKLAADKFEKKEKKPQS